VADAERIEAGHLDTPNDVVLFQASDATKLADSGQTPGDSVETAIPRRRQRMTKSVTICALFVALNSWSVASACSCRPGTTLEQQYEGADTILIAKISGCAPDRLSENGYCHGHGWAFETVENLKGSSAAGGVQPSDAGSAITSCDISLKVGDTYLLFLRTGRTYLCTGTGSLSGENGVRKMREVEILRAYRDGAITRITNPWHFSDSGWQCSIDHQFEGADIRFTYQYAMPSMAGQQGGGTLPKPIPRMMVRMIDPVGGPTLFSINADPVPLTRSTVELPRGTRFSFEMTHGDAALALLDRMSSPAELVVTGTRSASDGTTEPFRAITHTAGVPQLAAEFKACVGAHSDLN